MGKTDTNGMAESAAGAASQMTMQSGGPTRCHLSTAATDAIPCLMGTAELYAEYVASDRASDSAHER